MAPPVLSLAQLQLGQVALSNPLVVDWALSGSAGQLEGVSSKLEQDFAWERVVLRVQRLELGYEVQGIDASGDTGQGDSHGVALFLTRRCLCSHHPKTVSGDASDGAAHLFDRALTRGRRTAAMSASDRQAGAPRGGIFATELRGVAGHVFEPRDPGSRLEPPFVIGARPGTVSRSPRATHPCGWEIDGATTAGSTS